MGLKAEDKSDRSDDVLSTPTETGEARDRTSCRGRGFSRRAGLPERGVAKRRYCAQKHEPCGRGCVRGGNCSKAELRPVCSAGGALCELLPASVSGGYVLWACLAESRIDLRFVGGALLGGRGSARWAEPRPRRGSLIGCLPRNFLDPARACGVTGAGASSGSARV